LRDSLLITEFISLQNDYWYEKNTLYW